MLVKLLPLGLDFFYIHDTARRGFGTGVAKNRRGGRGRLRLPAHGRRGLLDLFFLCDHRQNSMYGRFNLNHQLVKGWRIYQMKTNMPHKSSKFFGLFSRFLPGEMRRLLRHPGQNQVKPGKAGTLAVLLRHKPFTINLFQCKRRHYGCECFQSFRLPPCTK